MQSSKRQTWSGQFINGNNKPLGIQGDARYARPPFSPVSFIFIQFSAKNLPNYKLAFPPLGLTPFVLEILDPSL